MAQKRRRRRRLKKWVKIAILILTIMMIVGCVFFIIKNKDKLLNTNPVSGFPTLTKPKSEMEYLYYYDETRHERYLAYQENNPHLTIDQVVWQVNIDMDKDDYTEMTMISEENENNIVLLVNKHFRLRDDYEPANLIYHDGYNEMTQETSDMFTKMANAASEDGAYLTPGSTYRSIDYQRDLYESYASVDGVEEADTYSARAGSSEHHTGRAIDLVGPDWTLDSFGGTYAHEWLINHGHEYGFIIRYKEAIEYITGYMDEPWHITYVGVDCATTMYEKNIESLEEYYVKYVMYSPTTN